MSVRILTSRTHELPLRGPEAFLGLISVVAILATYGGKAAHFYLYWVVSAAVLSIAVLLVAVRAELSRVVVGVVAAMATWAVFCFALTPTVHNEATHIQALCLTLLYTVVAITLAGCSVTTVPRLARYISVWVTSWLVLNIFLFLGFVAGVISYLGNAFAGPYGNRNLYAVTTLFLFALWLCFAATLKRRHGVYMYYAAALLLATMVLTTASTKGLVGLLVVVVVKVWASGKRAGMLRALFAAVGALGLGALIGGPNLTSRAVEKVEAVLPGQDPADVRISSSAFKRTELLLSSFALMSERPLAGVGVDNSRYFLFTQAQLVKVAKGEETADSGTYSHSNYTEMLLNGGVGAFIAFYLPLIMLLRRAVKIRPSSPSLIEARTLVIAIIALKLVLDIGMVSYSDYSHLFFVAIAWFVYKRLLCADRAASRIREARAS